jgi:hypothetical protein
VHAAPPTDMEDDLLTFVAQEDEGTFARRTMPKM